MGRREGRKEPQQLNGGCGGRGECRNGPRLSTTCNRGDEMYTTPSRHIMSCSLSRTGEQEERRGLIADAYSPPLSPTRPIRRDP